MEVLELMVPFLEWGDFPASKNNEDIHSLGVVLKHIGCPVKVTSDVAS